jgi:hypothetical protein
MKKLVTLTIIAAMMAAGTALKAQDNPEEYLGLPGDNLNLYAVMKLFRESKTLEEFEKNLNDQNTKINNLDLNGDNMVDYIMVFDDPDGDVHNIILRVAIDKKESQDVAVFTVQRFSDGRVEIQLTGDEELYGKNYIIEPIYDDNNGTPNPGYAGDETVVYGRKVTVVRTSPVYISTWPIVTWMYNPYYVSWRSSWYWDYYPVWWNPWRPYYWHYYYGFHYNYWYDDYYCHYRRWHVHRSNYWHDRYYSRARVYSPVVQVNIQKNYYSSTYSRPESRRDGEAVYSSKYPDRSRRSSVTTTSGTSTDRRAGNGSSVSTSGRRGEAATSTSRSADRSNERSSTAVSGSNRRSEGSVSTGRSSSERSQGTSVNRRSETTVNRSQTGRSESTVSRSEAPRTESSVSRSQNSSREATVSRSQTPRTESRVSSSQPSRSSASVSRSSSSSSGRESSAARSSGSSSRSSSAVSRSSSSSSSRSSGSVSRSSSGGGSSKSSGSSSRSSGGSSKSSESKSSSGRR